MALAHDGARGRSGADDVTADGQRFLIAARPPDQKRVLHIVSNWMALLPK